LSDRRVSCPGEIRFWTTTRQKYGHHPRLLAKSAEEYVHSHGGKVEEMMTANVITVSPDSPLQDVVRTMERQGVKRVPVVSDGKILGIISRANLVQALANFPEDALESRCSSVTSSTSLTSRRANQNSLLANLKLVPDAPSYRQSGSDRLAGRPF
jgi:CBS domain